MPQSFQTLFHESATAGGLSDTDLSVTRKILFASAPQRRSRLPGFSTSVLLHGVVLAVAAVWRVSTPPPSTAEAIHQQYHVRFVRLEMPPEYRRQRLPDVSAPDAQLPDPVRTQAAADHHIAADSSSTVGTAVALARRESAEEPRRQFKLPPNARVLPVKQTLVQMDVPPMVKLNEEIPLPTMLLWTERAAPPMRRQFVAPPLRREVPRVTQSLPAAPALSLPNWEINPADLNIAAMTPTEAPHLIHPPGVASPVAQTGQEPAKELPQIGLAESAEAHAVNLISLSTNPLKSSGVLVLPPANQIGASDVGLPGSANSGAKGTGAGEHGSPAESARISDERGARAGNTGAGNGTAFADSGAWSANGSAIGNILTGATRIDLPKEGQYGVVVLGSASSAPYPESAGALSGKTIYTVYLKVGLRKSWVLQYCLPPGKDQSSASGKSVSPVQAPWPFLIMRPDQRDTNPDYIILHGMVTDAGKFDQLALVFPDELENKQLLMDSLKRWAFRPASREGVPVAVEVLLIIPRETE